MLAVLAVITLWLTGCGADDGFQFDKLDVSPSRDSLTEFSLGHYKIPIPVQNDRINDNAPRSNRLEFHFELYALVDRQDAPRLSDDWDRHEGLIRDRVIQVCRNVSLDELQEPELTTLKSRLMDAMQGQLGERQVRRLLMTEIVSQRL